MPGEERKIELELKWQKDSYFEVTAQRDNNGPLVVIRVEGNSNLKAQWAHVLNAVKAFGEGVISEIGKEMIG